MCGIVGIVNFEGYAARDVKVMTEALRYRGPDQGGHMFSKVCGLGHRRLSIIDLSERGKQPMSVKHATVVFNGEVYNFQDLRKELGGKFASGSDTECILRGYLKYGTSVVERLRGMFAFALWDEEKKVLFAARDRLGKKPFYYAVTDRGSLVFASELSALLKCEEVSRRFSVDALREYLQFGYVSGRTVFEQVKKLPPGHLLVFGKDGLRVEKYWDVELKEADIGFDAAKQRVSELIDESVRLRLVSDVPLGALLSGGIDSTLVVASARKFLPVVKTFSIGFEQEKYDESGTARLISEKLGTVHHEKVLSDISDRQLQSIMSFMDEPVADSSAIPTFALSEFARRKVTVALSGDGGDEVFGGYLTYSPSRAERLARVVSHVPGGKLAAGGFAKAWPRLRVVHRLAGLSRFDAFVALESRFDEKVVSEGAVSSRRQVFDSASGDVLNRLMLVDVKTHLPDALLVKVDRMSMQHALEVRCPLLDQELVSFGFSLPSSYKIVNGVTKRVLRSLASDVVPAVARLPKRGFSVPLSEWARRGFIDIESPVVDFFGQRKGLFDENTWKFLSERRNSLNTAQKWSLCALEFWLKRVDVL